MKKSIMTTLIILAAVAVTGIVFGSIGLDKSLVYNGFDIAIFTLILGVLCAVGAIVLWIVQYVKRNKVTEVEQGVKSPIPQVIPPEKGVESPTTDESGQGDGSSQPDETKESTGTVGGLQDGDMSGQVDMTPEEQTTTGSDDEPASPDASDTSAVPDAQGKNGKISKNQNKQ